MSSCIPPNAFVCSVLGNVSVKVVCKAWGLPHLQPHPLDKGMRQQQLGNPFSNWQLLQDRKGGRRQRHGLSCPSLQRALVCTDRCRFGVEKGTF